ncbi:MAG: hypothetical protein QXO27_03960, partial [Candidatus Aenigmatarchaeota archaeon]
WQCTDWSECSNGVKTRSCIDINNCNTSFNKPVESQNCTVEPPIETPRGCVENWQCTDWSECSNGVKTRSCIDINNCNTSFNKPVESQNCTVEPQNQSQKTDCPFECCVNENDYFDKVCPTDRYCIDHACVVKEAGEYKKEVKGFNWLFVVGGSGSVAVLSLTVFTFFKVFGKKPASTLTFTEDLNATLKELSKEINSLKRFYDTSKLENELNLAKNALKHNLKQLAKIHIENIKKLKEKI